ncbi:MULTISPECIES: hypothetical protein [Streptomyces]|uniref:hypothetical protein n=1 Tax=Streptomyces TaxID=1883 RepID=UPI00163CCCCF|nr:MULTISPECIES: hypothetical protein [Streptomyces]MBC2878866.1 hypothetical protein [Streptomyces sp. TYQ1024]UBI38946.1 hypothetical protein K7I03_22480 [Streptomyces mobaraensis]UKW31525.1 hypothetical protein MCU78_22425 [Streptomyces sp. TYQ1024]
MTVLRLPRNAPSGRDTADDRGSADGPGATAEVVLLHPPTAPAPAPRPRPRLLGYALAACGLALLPWLVVLATSLPAETTAAKWSAAWVGLDALEALALITTGVLAVRRHVLHTLTAAVAATLLVADAWFDVMTAAPGADLASALVMAAAAELPLAAVCAVAAARGHRGGAGVGDGGEGGGGEGGGGDR